MGWWDAKLDDDEIIGGIGEATEGDTEETKLGKHVWLTHFATTGDKWLNFASQIANMYNGGVYIILLVFLAQMGEAAANGRSWSLWLGLMILAVGVNFGAGVAAAGCAELSAERQQRRMKLLFLEHLLNQEMGYFDKFDASVLATQLNYQSLTIRRATGQKFGQLWMYYGMIVGALNQMFNIQPKVAALSLALVPLIALTGWWAAHVDIQAEKISQKAFSAAAAVARESLQNIKTVKAFALEDTLASRFGTAAQKALNATSKASLLAGCALGLHWCIIFCSFGIGLWYGVKLITDYKEGRTSTKYTGEDIVQVFINALTIAFSLSKAFPTILSTWKARIALKQVLQIYARESKINPSSPDGDTTQLQGDIRFENVVFAYDDNAEKKVFQNLNLHIPAGTTTALVGASGSGKSTIVQLIERFYDVSGGAITIDGIPIGDLNLQSLRAQIALVSQEPRLFSDTIAANIGCGRDETTREEIIDAAKQANAHGFIMQFPSGYDTWVGEGGGQLSGGQKQRIAIARALIRNPQILILDEATSALDNESEKIVQSALNKIVKDSQRTTIIVAHRLSTIRDADKIAVLDNPDGNGAFVAEEGTHDELLRLDNGLYAALVASQLGTEAVGEDAPQDNLNWSSLRISADITAKYSKDLRASVDGTKKFSRDLRSRQSGSWVPELRRSAASNADMPEVWRLADHPYTKSALTDKPHYYRRTVGTLRKERWIVAVGIVGAVVAGFSWPVIGWGQARVTSCFFYENPERQRSEARKYILFFCLIGLATFIGVFLQRACLDRTAASLTKRMRDIVFDALLKKNVSFYDEPSHSPGAMVGLISLDLVLLGPWGGYNIAAYLTTIFVFLIAIFISMMAHWKLGLVTLAGSLILAPISWINSSLIRNGRMEIGKHSTDRNQEKQVVDGVVMNRSDAIMTEAILNIRTITAFNMQSIMSNRYQEAVLRDYKIGKRTAWLTGLAWGTSQCVILGILVLCIWYAFHLLSEEVVDGLKMAEAILILVMASFNMSKAFTALSDDVKARESAATIYEIVDEPKSFDEYSTKGMPIADVQEIKFHRVAFRYIRRPDLPIYRDVSFTVPRGKVTALVGGSGCGKSTAIQLMQYLYAIGEGFEYSDSMGYISYNNYNISDYNIQSLRQCIGIVSQEPALFWGTIEENIAYGREGATPEEIKDAAIAANAWEFIQRLPEGMQTDVGRGGAKLSGGQKQRIAIARALIRNPKLLILDEATSALDAESERIVQETLDQLLSSRQHTTVVIAHRLSTVRKADQIIVLLNADQRGSKIAEVGTHEELMRIGNGVYRGLVRIAENK